MTGDEALEHMARTLHAVMDRVEVLEAKVKELVEARESQVTREWDGTHAHDCGCNDCYSREVMGRK